MMTSIPKRMHFIWLGGYPPLSVGHNLRAFRDLNPDYEHIVHTDAKLLHPEYQTAYDAAPTWGMKSDLLRYSILEAQGGWYFDVDCRPYRSLDELSAQYEDLHGRMFTVGSSRGKKGYNNAMLAAEKECGIWPVIHHYVMTAPIPTPTFYHFGPHLFRMLTATEIKSLLLGKPEHCGEPHESGAPYPEPGEHPDLYVYHQAVGTGNDPITVIPTGR